MNMKIFASTVELEIRKANRDFYDAIESLKIERMEEIWLNSNEIQCIHPGWTERLIGWQPVMQSWYAIFQNTQYIEFNITDFNVTLDGQIAIVTCTEKMMSSVSGEIVHNELLATNIFQKTGDRWWLLLHHSS